MPNMSHEIYEKYKDKIFDMLENDMFHSYFSNVVETGYNNISFINRKLVKNIDESWIAEIELALPHIRVVAEKPRTFIEEQREVLNVGKVKKISVETVRHLTQHSEFISKFNDDGTIQPDKLLDVLKEDSNNTYENRFVYTLIKNAKEFVDRRAEVLLGNVNDEEGVFLNVDSKVDNYNEYITYKLEMRIRDKMVDDEETIMEKSSLLGRLASIQKELDILASSQFYKEMSKFTVVRHPIVKTNAIKKNVDYVACAKLWEFLHAYEKVGYKVDIIEQDSSTKTEFLKDIFDSIMLDYIILREYLDETSLINLNRQRRKKEINLNTLQSFMQELVTEYDISQSELRLLLLKEYNKAQKNKEKVEGAANRLNKIRQRAAEEEQDLTLVSEEWESFFKQDEEEVAKKKEKKKKKNSKRKILNKRIRAS
ncbi:MAG: hypothetical protein E7262_07495 [Lachnospiraceae bacterium]|nr:hypothetical protein [Lachnospiraceae bacterium]